MGDFPLWMKLIVWLVVGGTMAYAAGMMVFAAMQ